MANNWSDSLPNIAIFGVIAVGAYLLWSRFATKGGEVIDKACGELSGLPRILCELGGGVTGGFDFEKAYCDLFGGTVQPDGTCLVTPKIPPDYGGDKPGVCTPPQTWDYVLKQCVDPAPKFKDCGGGYWQYENLPCPNEDVTVCGPYPCSVLKENVSQWIATENIEALCNNPDTRLHGLIAQFMPAEYQDTLRLCAQGPGNEYKPNIKSCLCSDGHIAWVRADQDCTEICSAGFTDLNCYQKKELCGNANPGIGSAIGKSREACLADGYIYFDGMGACWNQARQDYMDCMKPCPNW